MLSARSCIPCHSEPSRVKNLPFFFCLLLLFCSSCTAPSTPPDTLSIPIPERWSQDLNAQASNWLAAQLRVYEMPSQTKVHDTTMEVDDTNGTVKAKSFKLPGGKTYKFIIEFQYLSQGEPIAFAYAEVEKEIGDGNAETVSFTSSDIRYEVDKQDPNISASISQGILPDLDPDNDGWSSYKELKDKVSPTDPSSIPQPPTLKLSAPKPEPGITDLIITLEGEDNAHVEEMKLIDPLCGVTKLSESTGSANGKVTKQIIYRLDLLSVNKGLTSRQLLATVEDGVTAIQGKDEKASFALDSNLSHPTFVFSDPEEGTELEGIQILRGVACGRYPLADIQLKSGGENLENYDLEKTPNVLGDIVIFNEVNTAQLPDGIVELEVSVSDEQGYGGSGKGTYKIANDSQIQVALPKGRKWVFGKEALFFTVVNLPKTTGVLATANKAGVTFSSKINLSESATYLLDVSNEKENKEGDSILITVEAPQSDGSEPPKRTIEFKVRNKPKIKVFKTGDLWKGWETSLHYEVENVDPTTLTINDQAVITDENKKELCSDNQGITTCKGSMKISPLVTTKYTLKASRRITTDANKPDEICGDQCKIAQDFAPEVTTWNGNIPRYGVDPTTSFTLPGDNSKEYRIRVIELDNNSQETTTIPIDEKKTGGNSLSLSNLKPRKDYKFKVEETSGTQILNTLEKIVTTGDQGLVLWLRFNEDPKGSPCAEQDDPSKTICDYSGNNNHGIPQGAPEWLEPPQSGILDGALKFDGVDDYVEIPNSVSLNPPSVSIQAKIEILGIVNGGHQEIIDKRLAGFGYELRVMGDGPLDAVVIISSDDPESSMGTVKSSILDLDTSYVLTATYDDIAKRISLYRNDELMYTDAALGTNIRTAPSTGSAFISKRSFDYPNPPWFNGNIDEISLYNRELSDKEVEDHYLSTSGD